MKELAGQSIFQYKGEACGSRAWFPMDWGSFQNLHSKGSYTSSGWRQHFSVGYYGAFWMSVVMMFIVFPMLSISWQMHTFSRLQPQSSILCKKLETNSPWCLPRPEMWKCATANRVHLIESWVGKDRSLHLIMKLHTTYYITFASLFDSTCTKFASSSFWYTVSWVPLQQQMQNLWGAYWPWSVQL